MYDYLLHELLERQRQCVPWQRNPHQAKCCWTLCLGDKEAVRNMHANTPGNRPCTSFKLIGFTNFKTNPTIGY